MSTSVKIPQRPSPVAVDREFCLDCAAGLIDFDRNRDLSGWAMPKCKFLQAILPFWPFWHGVSQVLFNKMIQISSPVFASSVTYTMPVVAVMWGVFDGERLVGIVLSAGIVLLGVYLAHQSKSQADQKPIETALLNPYWRLVMTKFTLLN